MLLIKLLMAIVMPSLALAQEDPYAYYPDMIQPARDYTVTLKPNATLRGKAHAIWADTLQLEATTNRVDSKLLGVKNIHLVGANATSYNGTFKVLISEEIKEHPDVSS